MKKSKRLWRTSLFFIILAALCGSFALPVTNLPVQAAPQMQSITPPHVVISEFRAHGSSGDDEFIEIFNASGSPVPITGWKLKKSSGCGITPTDLVTIGTVILAPGQYYLVGKLPGFTGPVDQSYSLTIADDGGIALVNASGVIVDQVGLCSTTLYKELDPLPQLTMDKDQSYERKPGITGNCSDTDNNVADFFLNSSSSNPQTSQSAPSPCLVVTKVTSPDSDALPYKAGDIINITVVFSSPVNVTGVPNLLLETGTSDGNAIYKSGSGSDTLLFQYTVAAGDTSGDLDYVAVDSLVLNGGTIIGAVGDANLALSYPGTAGSLSANKNLVIDNSSAPILLSFKRQSPTSTFTNVNNVVFRATFSETVINVDATDFKLHDNNPNPNTTAVVTAVSPNTNSYYDITVSGGNLSTFNGNVSLDLSATQNITDLSGNVLSPMLEPAVDEEYIVDHIVPLVTINQSSGQTDPTTVTPVNFTVVFSEPIDVSTFTTSDITQSTQAGSAKFITWKIIDSGDHQTFTVSAISITQNGNLIPSIVQGQVKDLAGNLNTISTSIDNTVSFNDNLAPTVTVNQVATQVDPTGVFPIKFDVLFSEPIKTSTFATSDITQNGTAPGVIWTIVDAGDQMHFTLSATAVTGTGTLIPSIGPNHVTDIVGNSNAASTSTDNSVTYTLLPTPTATSTGTSSPSILINEVAWSGTSANSNDEWIELYNPGSSPVDLTGWLLYGDDNTLNKVGNPSIALSGTIAAGGFFLLERDQLATDVTASQVYSSGDLLNTGERLYLKDKSGNTIDTANLDGGIWPAGTAATAYASMERVGKTGNQWVTYAGTIPLAHDRNGGAINGTPGKSNWISTTSITTITSDTPDPSVVNQIVTVTVKVTGGTNTPTGTVAITGANTNCTITLSAGTGSCAVKFTSKGTKTLTATYTSTNGLPFSNDTESHQVVVSGTTFATPIPTLAPPPPLVAINEFVPRPGHDWNNDGVVNVGDEYIELLNHGVVNVNLSGYSLDDEVNIGSNPYRLPAVVIKPGERLVFYGNETNLLLSDGGDGVRLLKPNGQLADAYNYSVAGYPDQSYCRLPDNGGADDWNQNCFPTPGLQNSLSGDFSVPVSEGSAETLCPIADTLPYDFVWAECEPFGNNIWRQEFWDQTGWFDERTLPGIESKWPVFAD